MLFRITMDGIRSRSESFDPSQIAVLTRHFPEPPAGQLRLASPDVLEFTSSLLQSVVPGLPSHYFSTGGDEINTECYAQDSDTQITLKRRGWSFEGALSNFVVSAHRVVKSLGKVPVVWEGVYCFYDDL